jgi:undecaprenyl-diphosphatase
MPAWILRLGEYDERLLLAVVSRRRVGLDLVLRFLTHLGDAPVAIALTGGMSIGAFPGLEDVGRVAAFTLAFSHLLVQLLKRSISRPRPSLPVGLGSLIRAPDRFSFPSGHAAAGLSVALPLALALSLPLGLLLLILGVGIGLTRCYLGVHYPGDVLAGWSLAVLAFLLYEPFLLLLR